MRVRCGLRFTEGSDAVRPLALARSLYVWVRLVAGIDTIGSPAARHGISKHRSKACCTSTARYSCYLPVTKTSLRDTPICLILCVPFLPIGWELCVPVRTGALVAPWQMPHYWSPRTAPSGSKDMVLTSIAGAQHPAMISRTLIWHHSHYWEVPLRGRRWLQPTRHSSWRSTALLL